MNPNMVNLTLEVNSLKKIIATWEKEKEKTFQKGYKHNVEIQRKNMTKAKQKIKMLIKKLYDENEELKGSTTWLKLQDEKQQALKQKDEI